MKLTLTLAAAMLSFTTALAATHQAAPQTPAAPAPAGRGAGGGGGGGRGGGIPGATPEQLQAITDMNAALAPLTAAVTSARNEVATATFADPRSDTAIKAAIDKLQSAELALAMKRKELFAALQAGPNKLNADQVTALIAAGGAPAGGRRGGGGPGRGGGGL